MTDKDTKTTTHKTASSNPLLTTTSLHAPTSTDRRTATSTRVVPVSRLSDEMVASLLSDDDW